MDDFEAMQARVVKFLGAGEATVRRCANEKQVLVDAGDRGTIAVDRAVLSEMARQGALTMSDGRVSLNRANKAVAGRMASHRDLETATVMTETGPETVTVNWAESPLGQLMRRKTKEGASFLSAAEYSAGERLRADYTRGQIMPRLSANWEASVSSGRRSGGIPDLTDAALAARLRVESAIAAVGPELSGILVDVCCFLKGMETVEMERGWPVRSAKIVLKTALGVLSRHYDPRPQKSAKPDRTLHWGAADYRPSLT